MEELTELRAKFNLYLKLKDGETEEQAIDRLQNILDKVQKENSDFSTSELQ